MICLLLIRYTVLDLDNTVHCSRLCATVSVYLCGCGSFLCLSYSWSLKFVYVRICQSNFMFLITDKTGIKLLTEMVF